MSIVLTGHRMGIVLRNKNTEASELWILPGDLCVVQHCPSCVRKGTVLTIGEFEISSGVCPNNHDQLESLSSHNPGSANPSGPQWEENIHRTELGKQQSLWVFICSDSRDVSSCRKSKYGWNMEHARLRKDSTNTYSLQGGFIHHRWWVLKYLCELMLV